MCNYNVKDFNNEKLLSGRNRLVIGVDLGGTNTNFGIACLKDDNVKMLYSLNFKTQDLNSLIPAFLQTIDFVKEKKLGIIERYCIGAAGVVSDDFKHVDLTNISWDVNIDELNDKIDLNNGFIINDFQAIGYGINHLNSDYAGDILKIKEGIINKEKFLTKSVIGAGTGLGKSILIYDENKEMFIPLSSEGGHSDIPVNDDFELELINYIKKLRNINENVCYEELLSGRGIEAIYNFLTEQSNAEETKFTEEIRDSKNKSILISKNRKNDKTCSETFRIFIRFYARCAKNFVLETMSQGGLYLAGGIAMKNHDLFYSEEFINEFNNAYKRHDVLKKTPIYLIMNYDVSLFGTCIAAKNYQNR